MDFELCFIDCKKFLIGNAKCLNLLKIAIFVLTKMLHGRPHKSIL